MSSWDSEPDSASVSRSEREMLCICSCCCHTCWCPAETLSQTPPLWAALRERCSASAAAVAIPVDVQLRLWARLRLCEPLWERDDLHLQLLLLVLNAPPHLEVQWNIYFTFANSSSAVCLQIKETVSRDENFLRSMALAFLLKKLNAKFFLLS